MQEIATGVFVETSFRRINVGAILTDDGFVLIDTPPYPDDAHLWRDMLAEIADVPILAIVNTDCHRERIVGNGWFNSRVIVAHNETIAQLTNLPSAFLEQTISALITEPGERSSFSEARIQSPTIGFSHRMQLRYGGRVIPILSMPGPTNGSVWVHLPDERVVFTGDSVITGEHLHITGACTKSWLESLTLLRRSRFTADQIVAGRGPLVDKSATEPISAYLRLARRRVQSLFRSGRPRADTSTLVPELLSLFPYDEADPETAQRRIKIGLDRIYEEIKTDDQTDDMELE